MILDAELVPDEIGDAVGRPEVGTEAVGRRLLRQPRLDLTLLQVGEEPGSAGGRLESQAGVAPGTMAGHPFGECDGVDAEDFGHGDLGLTLENLPDGQTTTRFQRRSSSFASHAAQDRVLQRS